MRLVLSLFIGVFLTSALSAEMSSTEAIELNIRVENVLLQSNIETFANLYSSWANEMIRYRGLEESHYQIVRGENIDLEELNAYSSQLQAQWGYLNGLQAQLNELRQQILQRMERLKVLETEHGLVREEERVEDPISGRWSVEINPGDFKGVFKLKLSTTLVVGDYSLSGGWTGSLKGTLVGDRLRLERIDSEKGYIAVYYAKLNREEGTLSGSWESTMFTTGGPMGGTWTARRIDEP